MNRYDKMTNSIRTTWRSFAIIMLMLTLIVALFTLAYTMKAKMYKQEYESTTWYEMTANYTRSNEYTERDEDGDDVTKYTNFYQYIAKDGKTYEYADINCSSKAVNGDTVQIFVDEKNYSHNLEVPNDKGIGKMKVIIFWICVPTIAIYSIILILKYIVRAVVKATMNR